MKREINLGNVIGIVGAGVAILGMFLPCFEFFNMETSWYQLVVDYGGMTGLGLGEIIALVVIILLAGYLIFAGSCGTGLAIGFLSFVYFIVNYFMSTEEMQNSGVQMGIGAGIIAVGEIVMIVGGFAGAMSVQGNVEENQSNNNVSQEDQTIFETELQQDAENTQEKTDWQNLSDENVEKTENVVCPNCGENLKERTKFCPNCGTKLVFCSGCHSVLKEESRFCPYCGTKQQEK